MRSDQRPADQLRQMVRSFASDEVAPIAGWITPMPGGTGPMTVACLLENTLTAARLRLDAVRLIWRMP